MARYRECTVTELLVLNTGRDYHDPELEAEICRRAGLLEEFEVSYGDTYGKFFELAVEVLKLRRNYEEIR